MTPPSFPTQSTMGGPAPEHRPPPPTPDGEHVARRIVPDCDPNLMIPRSAYRDVAAERDRLYMALDGIANWAHEGPGAAWAMRDYARKALASEKDRHRA